MNVNEDGIGQGAKKKRRKTNDLKVLINGRYFIGRSIQ